MISDDELFAGLKFLLRHAGPEYRTALEIAAEMCRKVREGMALDEMRNRPTDDLELSVRSLNALQRMEIKTVGDVEAFVALPDREVLKRGTPHFFTKKNLKEVRKLLGDVGLKVVPNVTDARGGFIGADGKVNKSGRID